MCDARAPGGRAHSKAALHGGSLLQIKVTTTTVGTRDGGDVGCVFLYFFADDARQAGGPHYDEDAPEKLLLKRRKLVSALVRPVSNYASGLLRDGAVHLAPLSTTLQMRPDLSHVDDDIDAEDKGRAPKTSKQQKAAGA